MEKSKKIQEINGEFQLPEAIIQHIQSFLSGKEAAQTTVLSKSWYSAWLTRPNLVFDERDFRRNGRYGDTTDGFSEFARKTMQRYEELNLKIESFRLFMQSTHGNGCLLANELIVKAMKMGAIELDFVSARPNPTFVLPHEVLGSETLIMLSVDGCRVDGKVSCSRLKSLNLCKVPTESHMIWNIISSCPSIEKLRFCLSGYKRTFCGVGPVVDASIHLHEFHKLKCLLLSNVRIDTVFFSDFPSKIPCLKELSLDYCDFNGAIRIFSTSLECISWNHYKMLRAVFDVPNIRKFNYKGPDFPSLTFITASREWDSDISITCSRYADTPWFLKLKKFLETLCLSKISLTIKVGCMKASFDYARDIKGLSKAVVENLTVEPQSSVQSSVFSAFLDGLFWSCRVRNSLLVAQVMHRMSKDSKK